MGCYRKILREFKRKITINAAKARFVKAFLVYSCKFSVSFDSFTSKKIAVAYRTTERVKCCQHGKV